MTAIPLLFDPQRPALVQIGEVLVGNERGEWVEARVMWEPLVEGTYVTPGSPTIRLLVEAR